MFPRAVTSRYPHRLYGCGDLTMEQMGKGFERLFESIDDLAKDVPAARAMAAKFLARAVADEVRGGRRVDCAAAAAAPTS